MFFSFILPVKNYVASVFAALCAVKQSELRAHERREWEKADLTWPHLQESAKITLSYKERSTLRPRPRRRTKSVHLNYEDPSQKRQPNSTVKKNHLVVKVRHKPLLWFVL